MDSINKQIIKVTLDEEGKIPLNKKDQVFLDILVLQFIQVFYIDIGTEIHFQIKSSSPLINNCKMLINMPTKISANEIQYNYAEPKSVKIYRN